MVPYVNENFGKVILLWSRIFRVRYNFHIARAICTTRIGGTTNNKEVRVRRRTYLSVKSVCHSSNFTYVKRIKGQTKTFDPLIILQCCKNVTISCFLSRTPWPPFTDIWRNELLTSLWNEATRFCVLRLLFKSLFWVFSLASTTNDEAVHRPPSSWSPPSPKSALGGLNPDHKIKILQ